MDSLDARVVDARLEAIGFARSSRTEIAKWLAWVTGAVAARAIAAPNRFHIVPKQIGAGGTRLGRVVFAWKREGNKDSDGMIVVNSDGFAVFVLGVEDHRAFPCVPESEAELGAWRAAIAVLLERGWTP